MVIFQTIILPDGRLMSYSLSTDVPLNRPVVILANSLCADATSWDKIVPVLHGAGLRVLRFNQPGHGGSGSPTDLSSTSFESIADDVLFLINSLGLKKVHGWIGVSMGAATGIVFATKYPAIISRLVVCDTISCSYVNDKDGVDVFGPRVEAARKDGAMTKLIEGTLNRWFGEEWMLANPDETSRMRTLMGSTTVDGFETCCAALKSISFDLRPLFIKVGASVDDALLIVGENDANLPQTMEVMRKCIEAGFRAVGKNQNISLRVVPSAGHVCYIDGFESFC
ncbi:alpha/beta-hydrolase [Thozetella sp. PMI_491]|nr:alpha/beta-hydrolase [Thozetella sp. PMI_491]